MPLSRGSSYSIQKISLRRTGLITILSTSIHTSLTTSIGYIRMHGNPKLFYSEYTIKQLESLYHEVTYAGFDELYIYFNNTASTAAIINAQQLKTIAEECPGSD